jgi:hypothetical protein
MTRFLALSLVLGLSPLARAASPAGSCTGMLVGQTNLAVEDGSLYPADIDAVQAQTTFGAAECECGSSDFLFSLRLTRALPLATAGSVEVWVGQDCDQYERRVGGLCEKIAAPGIQSLTSASTSSGSFVVPLPSRALFAPGTHDCGAKQSANNVYLIAFTDPTQPFAGCKLDLVQDSRIPATPTGLTAEWQSDGSLQVSWAPLVDGRHYTYYVAAETSDGHPATALPLLSSSQYSMCLSGGRLERRSLRAPDQSWLEMVPPTLVATDPLAASQDRVVATVPDASWSRLELDATQGYRISVVATDEFGNAAPSAELQVEPASVPDEPEMGGCSLGGHDAAALPGLLLLAVALALVLARRGRRA